MKTPTPEVVAAAQAAQAKYMIPASVSLAQWALESAWGTRCSGRFNFFGIKASPPTPGSLCWTHEQRGDRLVACQQRFRDFDSLEQAFDYHAFLLAMGRPYEAAMAALKRKDVSGFIKLMAAHYATDPSYAAEVEFLRSAAGNDLARYDTP